ncbi:MAG: hypothetical protein FWG32_03670 [Oscillospiraceae bacterium]|nr:hypothetical protein [Oscillospiraceae bacterium]
MSAAEQKVERTYEWYSREVNGQGLLCYYGLVTDAYTKAMIETPGLDFEDFDDAFLKKLAGIEPERPLPLKSNEVFDETYWSHLVRWYYIPCNCCNSFYNGPLKFMEHVRSGNIEPYAAYYERELPMLK